jgi:hypothetical protein
MKKILLLVVLCMGCAVQKPAKYKINYLESSMIVYSNEMPKLLEDTKVYKFNGINYTLIVDFKE